MRRRVVATIVKDNKILLMRRIKKGEEYFVFPGGGVMQGEELEQALKREIKEEFGLEIGKIEKFFEFQNMNQQEYYYLVKDFSGQPKLGGEEKDRMNEDNQYYPVWQDLADLKNLNNLYPQEAKEKVIELYGN